MKRFLSLILVSALLVTLLPTAFASEAELSGARVTYVFNYSLSPKPEGYSSEKFASNKNTAGITYEDTVGFFEWVSPAGGFTNNGAVGVYGNVAAGSYAAVKIYIPEAGKYNLTYTYHKRDAAYNPITDGELHFIPANMNIEKALETSTPALSNISYLVESSHSKANAYGEVSFDASGEYYAVFTSASGAEGNMYMWRLMLDGGNTEYLYGKTAVTDNTLVVGDTTQAAYDVYTSYNFTKITSGITYKSSDEKVIKVDPATGAVEAVGSGEAEILLESSTYGLGKISAAKVKVASVAPITASLDYETLTSVKASATGEDGEAVDLSQYTVTYSSEDEATATVDEKTGMVTPVKAGTVALKAEITNGDWVAEVTMQYNSFDPTPAAGRATYRFDWDANYVPGYSFAGKTDYPTVGITYEDTNGFWRWIDGNAKIHPTLGAWSGDIGTFKFAIYVPTAGCYDVEYQYGVRNWDSAKAVTNGKLYFLPGNTTDVDAAIKTAIPVIANVSYGSEASASYATAPTQKVYFPEAGEYIVVATSDGGSYMSVLQINLSNTSAEDYVYGVTKSADNSLTVGEKTTISYTLYNSLRNSGKFSQITSGVVFESSDTDVLKVDENGNVEAIAPGTAIVTAKAQKGNNGNILGAEIRVVGKAPETVSFAAVANVADITVEGVAGVDGSVTRGTKVSLTAPDKDGYKFVGWKRGSAATGKFIKDAPQKNFEYTILSNGCLTAMYDELSPEKYMVEFWNGNGEHLETIAVVDNALEKEVDEPSLIGFAFDDWYVDDTTKLDITNLTSMLTRAVAKYNEKTATFAVTNPDNYNNTIARTYDFAVKFSEDAEGTWKRNGNVVAYGSEYIYYTWDNAEIEYVEGVKDKAPLVVLEYSSTHSAYMIEYDKGSALEIAEAGILFGNGTPTVESGAMEKYTSQRSVSHGQFTAKPENESYKAVGYIVYKDSDGYKVIYDTID